MNINLKEILLGLLLVAILALLLKLTFFQKESGAGSIPAETLMKLDSLQKSTGELSLKNAALEERISSLEEEDNSLEQSKETVRHDYTQKKTKYEQLNSGDRETEFKNYIKNTNPDFYRKLYGDK